MKNTVRLVTAAMIFSLLSLPLFCQEEKKEDKYEKIEYYSLGDKTFTVNAGLFAPLFFFNLTGDPAFAKTNLTVGGTGSLAFDAYLSNNIKLGGEVGGMFAYSPNTNPFFMIPITARGTYEFHFSQFSLPIYLGLGVNIISYEGNTTAQFIAKPGVGFYWNYSSSWSFGANLIYWLTTEYVLNNADQFRIGNFLDFTISAQYHF